MDLNPRTFETSQDAVPASVGTPLACRRAMPAQKLEAWTPVAILGALVSAVLAVPRALVMAPSFIRRRA